MKTIEYRVRPVTRYIVTEHVDYGSSGSTKQLGEFANAGMAENVAMKFARAEAVTEYAEDAPERTTKIIHHDGRVYERIDGEWFENVDAALRRGASMSAEMNAVYTERNQVVAALARVMLYRGFDVALTKTDIPGWDAEWHGCVYIDSPDGQMSWHFHDSDAHLFEGLPVSDDVEWDGHTTPEKYERLRGLCASRSCSTISYCDPHFAKAVSS